MAKSGSLTPGDKEGKKKYAVAQVRVIRDVNVILDLHLAQLYGIELKELRSLVSKNANRFPPDFMFRLTEQEIETELRYLLSDLSYLPLQAFTVEGMAMVTSLIDSKECIQTHIQLIRVFRKMKNILFYSEDGYIQLNEIVDSSKMNGDVQLIFTYLKLMDIPTGTSLGNRK